MKILIYEYISGGGLADEYLSPTLLSEGFAMLKGLVSDFKNANHTVTVMLDNRIINSNSPVDADYIIKVYSKNNQLFTDALQTVDCAYIVAPETNGILESIVSIVEKNGTLSLNCSSESIKQSADKAKIFEYAKNLGLDIPRTFMFKAGDIDQIKNTILEKTGFPVIIKPLNGAGCSGLSLVKNIQEVSGSIEKIVKDNLVTMIIVQELISGIPASVSLISTDIDVAPISLNKQNVTLSSEDSDSSYNGGEVPLNHPLKAQAFAAATKLVKSFSGLKGYIGVDVILTEDKVFIIEVNPRLTTSYVGLRKVLNINLAQTILDSILKKELPQNISNNGYCLFSKVPISLNSSLTSEDIYRIPEIISPPFYFPDATERYAFVESYCLNFDKAKNRFEKIKETLQFENQEKNCL